MTLIHLIVIIIGATIFTSDAVNSTNPSCFQFTWLGPVTNTNINCSALKDTPCIAPFVVTTDQTPPDVTYMWNNLDQEKISCSLFPGFACIKYTYNYNNAIRNISFFCGKMVEDETTPITYGCYTQKVRGYIVEVCACDTGDGGIPCNSSNWTRYSINHFIVLTFIFMLIKNIVSC